MPINARMAGGYKRSPIETSVDESPIMIPQLLNPKNAKKILFLHLYLILNR